MNKKDEVEILERITEFGKKVIFKTSFNTMSLLTTDFFGKLSSICIYFVIMKTHMSICLWFDKEALEAAKFYTSLFKDSEIGEIQYYGQEGFDIHGQPQGNVMTIQFRLNDMRFTALNGGPHFKFNESVSIVLTCDSDNEVDYYWEALTADGGQESQCGWLKDKFGLSWQVVPKEMTELLKNPEKREAVTKAFLQMRKLDMKILRSV